VHARTDPAILAAMADMFRRGCSAEQLADLYGISLRQVQRRLARRGLHVPRRRTPAQQLAIEMRRGQIHLLRGRGLSVSQMARHLRLHPRYLRLWMSRHMLGLLEQMKAEVMARGAARAPRSSASEEGLPARAPLTRWRRAAIKRDYLAGYSIAAIARHYGHHRTTIWRLLRRQRVPLRPRAARSPRWLRAVRERRMDREKTERESSQEASLAR